MASTREQRRDRNRAAILDSARELIIERGLEVLSLREVAARAGYSPAGLYRYFRDKEDLVSATAQDAVQSLATFFADVPADLPGTQRLIAIGLRYLDFARDAPEQFTLIFSRLPIPFTTWEQFTQDAWPFRVLLDEVRRGVEAGEIESGPGRGSAEIAYGCWAFVHGLAMLRLTRMRGVESDFDATHRVLVESFVDSLRTRR
jgi:AcrR family transcriptional regulator